ncbi:MAG: TDP-N-acetylfucosamine:lipid II N-acetylfucosaminyltransferase [Brevinematia bacterium]
MIAHIMILDKFIPPFIDFIEENFDEKDHIFILFSVKENKYGLKENSRIVWVYPDRNLIFFMRWLKFAQKLIFVNFLLYKSKKIIFHGLWDFYSIFLMLLQPWLFKKCYWVMWGGDFYFPEEQPWWRKTAIRRIRHCVAFLENDFEIIKTLYGGKNKKFYECFMYPNSVKLSEASCYSEKNKNFVNLMIGNSATETNKHLEIFNLIKKYSNKNVKIFVPLSYGEESYKEFIIDKGKEIFGKNFIPITEYFDLDDYFNFIKKIDIAIFGSLRSQGLGNIISLLGMGKKVYLRRGTSQWKFFEKIKVKIFDIENIDLEPMKKEDIFLNISNIKKYFSKENSVKNWKDIFES